MAGADPKTIVNQTEKLAKHLEAFEKRKTQYDADFAKAIKQLKEIESLTASVLKTAQEDIKRAEEARVNVARHLKSLEEMQTEVKKGGDFEMIYRRFLDAKKAYRLIIDEWGEKAEALQKAKNDKNAQKEFEIADKALHKVGVQFDELFRQSQDMLPSKTLKAAEWVASDLLKDLDEYDRLMRAILKNVDWMKFDEVTNRLKRYGY